MLILASQSSRRKELLGLLESDFSICPVHIDENVIDGEIPENYVIRMAREKAEAALIKYQTAIKSDDLIIGADTAVVQWETWDKRITLSKSKDEIVDQQRGRYRILGKPSNTKHAQEMLIQLRGKIHQVFSAVVVMEAKSGRSISDVCITDVPMRDYTEEEVAKYISSGDGMDKAGAYAIQNFEFNPVHNLQGCYTNVMGLPLCHLTRILLKIGFEIKTDVPETCQGFIDYKCPVFPEFFTLK